MLDFVVEGQDAARMIKSTQNLNMRTPIVAVTSFESYVSEQGTLFAAVLAKPVIKADLLAIFRKLGFVAKQKQTGRTEGGGSTGSGSGAPGTKERKDSVELLKAELPPEGGSVVPPSSQSGQPKKGPLGHLSGSGYHRERRGTGASSSTDSSSGPGTRHASMAATVAGGATPIAGSQQPQQP